MRAVWDAVVVGVVEPGLAVVSHRAAAGRDEDPKAVNRIARPAVILVNEVNGASTGKLQTRQVIPGIVGTVDHSVAVAVAAAVRAERPTAVAVTEFAGWFQGVNAPPMPNSKEPS